VLREHRATASAEKEHGNDRSSGFARIRNKAG
jgi:hypothetical protein